MKTYEDFIEFKLKNGQIWQIFLNYILINFIFVDNLPYTALLQACIMAHMTKSMQNTFPQRHQIMAILIAGFAFFMSGLVSERVFENMPHLEDELAYLYQARIFAGGQIVIESPQPANAYWQPFVVDSGATGNRFGKYTPGWSAILAIGVLLGQEWVINAFLASLTIALVYRLGCEIFSPDIAIIASLLVAFSPAALLLNGTMMSHSSGLFFTTLFIYAYWRIEKGEKRHLWGMVAGISLGILAATRPLTTLGIGLPFIAWSIVRLVIALMSKKDTVPLLPRMTQILTPLLVLSAFTLIIASTIPAFSFAATGDPQQNLYELVWDYDRIGFGEGYGRNRHRLEKALNHARFDLSLTAVDLFGWQFEPVDDEMILHFQTESDYYPSKGYSFYLLPLGLFLGLFLVNRRHLKLRLIWFAIWSIVAIAWVWFPLNLTTQVGDFGTVASIFGVEPTLIGDETFSWIWISLALLWLYIPLFIYHNLKETPQIPYTWLIFSVLMSVVIVQMLYWIGSQRYSTRYYYEGLASAALLTAIPIAYLINKIASLITDNQATRIWRIVAYGVFLSLCFFTLYNYSTPRIMALYRFNGISPELIQEVEAQRIDDTPILVIVSGASTGDERVRWRSYGALMAVTSPYLDSDIVAVRDYGTSRQDFIEQFPDRQVIDVYAVGNDAYVQDPFPTQSD